MFLWSTCIVYGSYDEGRCPAVFKSPECHDWVLSAKAHQNQTLNCQFETTQGWRSYQEDRISCNLDMQIPLHGINGPEDVRVGVVAVFDGHIGQQASEMASKLLLDYFFVHSVFGSYKNSHSSEGLTNMEILKQALVRTINDIDSTFTEEAVRKKLPAGSTAVVALLVDGQILVANVGDSKALLCSVKPHRHGTPTAHLHAKELTRDHNPHREEEKARIEAAGGVIYGYDTPVINGHFPMTRAIGDVPLKMYGIIPDPEVTDWQRLTANDRYLVVASDGIFESLKPQYVCDLLRDAHFEGSRRSKQPAACLSLSSLANCIVRNAFERGSTDNLSAVVVPLRSAGFSPK